MGSEKIVGAIMLIFPIIIIILYALWGILAPIFGESYLTSWGSIWGIPVPPLYWLIMIPLFLAILVMGGILAWIGLALIQSPEPTEINIEEIEKELEELEKEEEKEESKEETSKEG